MSERVDMDEIDGADGGADGSLGPDVRTLVLVNPRGIAVDEVALGARLAALPGIERVRTLLVDFDSRVRNLRFLRALPHLEGLTVHGDHLETVEGIGDFRGASVRIDTEGNRRRDLAALASARVASLTLEVARPEDIQAVAGCASLRSLILSHAPLGELAPLGAVELHDVSLGRGRGDTLDVSCFPRVEHLALGQCRQLERLVGTCPAEVLAVQACNRLELATLRSLPELVSLKLGGRKDPIRISAFAGFARLERLFLEDGSVELDAPALRAPNLREVFIRRLRPGQGEALSAANPGVLVKDATHATRDGQRS